MPEPRGQGFVMRAKVDADHASDTVTRRSRTGFLIYLNSALIYWSSKKQTSVESSSFGSEFIAMKQCCEYVRGLRYKLRMMGITCEGPTYIQADNQYVLVNSSIPDSTLKKKSQSIAYHFVDRWLGIRSSCPVRCLFYVVSLVFYVALSCFSSSPCGRFHK